MNKLIGSVVVTAIVALTGGIALNMSKNESGQAETVVKKVQVEKPQPKTVVVAVERFKDVDMDEVNEYFLDRELGNSLDTKILAISEGDGYGFLSGSATLEDMDGNVISTEDSNTDPNAATVREVLEAIKAAKKNQ